MIDTAPAAANDSRTASLVQRELSRIAERFAEADTRAWKATVLRDKGELETAEAERQDANGEYHGASWDLADLLLLLLRHCLQHRRDALAMYLADALRDPLGELAEAVVRLEGRRV